MSKLLLVCLTALVLGGCAHRERAPTGVIVDMKGVDRARYENDIAECSAYVDQVAVGEKAAVGAAGGAVVGGLIGAAVGGSRDSAKEGAGAGAVVGGAKGTLHGVRERRQVMRNCLRNRGYSVLN